MSLNVRNIAESVAYALAEANNRRQLDSISTFFHMARLEDTSGQDWTNPAVTRVTVTAANGTDSPTAVVLVNNIRVVLDRHYADDIAHDTATSAAITIATATDTTTAITLANDLKAKHTVHITAASVHFTNDGTNTITNANATDLTTLNVLINEIKGDINAHLASAPAGTWIKVVPA